ncbi:MAG: L-ribulose-5-phosphate 4-epimerase AraD [Planctomycetota bacterium]
MLESLKREVHAANRALVEAGLVTLTWGNVSGCDRAAGLMVIKPSGVPYAELTDEQMVVIDLEGHVVEGVLRPSSDTPTHVLLYRSFPAIGGIAHTHSRYATIFAQARREIPCLGTTHADHFHGPVPLTRPLAAEEVDTGYEQNTGAVIVERFSDAEPMATPAVLVAGHGPFTWGRSATEAVDNAVALEAVAEMALGTLSLTTIAAPLEDYLIEKHHQRKHGAGAYYGQK